MNAMRKALVLMMVAFGVVSAGWAAAAVAADPPAKAKGKGAVHVDISAIGRDGTTRSLAVTGVRSSRPRPRR